MATALDVARYLIQLAAVQDEPDWLSNLRVQKLLYFSQGWSLGLRGLPMFDDKVEAWSKGPVVPSVYHVYKNYGFFSIPHEAGNFDINIDQNDAQIVEMVWDSWKGYSATKLSELTHRSQPWIEARAGLGPDENSSNEITIKSMADHFAPVKEFFERRSIEASALRKEALLSLASRFPAPTEWADEDDD
jgi:uncharacterized phage-associated protein